MFLRLSLGFKSLAIRLSEDGNTVHHMYFKKHTQRVVDGMVSMLLLLLIRMIDHRIQSKF